MALLITPDGKTCAVSPKNGSAFTAAEIQALVEGWLEYVRLRDGRLMWINEEGKLRRLPHNPLATMLARSALRPGDSIVGPVVVTTRQEAGEPAPDER